MFQRRYNNNNNSAANNLINSILSSSKNNYSNGVGYQGNNSNRYNTNNNNSNANSNFQNYSQRNNNSTSSSMQSGYSSTNNANSNSNTSLLNGFPGNFQSGFLSNPNSNSNNNANINHNLNNNMNSNNFQNGFPSRSLPITNTNNSISSNNKSASNHLNNTNNTTTSNINTNNNDNNNMALNNIPNNGNNWNNLDTINAVGTVTELIGQSGIINDAVYFDLHCVIGPYPKLYDPIAFEAINTPNARFKWEATKAQVISSMQINWTKDGTNNHWGTLSSVSSNNVNTMTNNSNMSNNINNNINNNMNNNLNNMNNLPMLNNVAQAMSSDRFNQNINNGGRTFGHNNHKNTRYVRQDGRMIRNARFNNNNKPQRFDRRAVGGRGNNGRVTGAVERPAGNNNARFNRNYSINRVVRNNGRIINGSNRRPMAGRPGGAVRSNGIPNISNNRRVPNRRPAPGNKTAVAKNSETKPRPENPKSNNNRKLNTTNNNNNNANKNNNASNNNNNASQKASNSGAANNNNPNTSVAQNQKKRQRNQAARRKRAAVHHVLNQHAKRTTLRKTKAKERLAQRINIAKMVKEGIAPLKAREIMMKKLNRAKNPNAI